MNYLTPGGCDYFIEQQVMVLLAGLFSLPRRTICFESRIFEDLGLDTAELATLIEQLNRDFAIELSVLEVARWRTVADLCRLVGLACGEREGRRNLLR